MSDGPIRRGEDVSLREIQPVCTSDCPACGGSGWVEPVSGYHSWNTTVPEWCPKRTGLTRRVDDVNG